MSNQMVSVDNSFGGTLLSLAVRRGNFRVPKNKNLDRPRFVREACEKTTCIGLGCGDGGGGGKGMSFAGKRESELWGRK